jgi:hypothetical protein
LREIRWAVDAKREGCYPATLGILTYLSGDL